MTTTLDTPTPAPPEPAPLAGTRRASPGPPPTVDLVVPVYNEEAELEAHVERLHAYVSAHLPVSCRIVIADNASTDGTARLARQLAARLPGVDAVHLAEKGRGRALAHVWSRSDAQIVAYLDVDLSTDLAALLPLLAPLLTGHSDVAIGTRLARSARVVRGTKREVISRCYNRLLHATLRTRFTDAQCGFKALRADCARQLLPLVRDGEWFFDTELLVLAERAGLRIHEVPVDWVDDPDSRVDIASTALADLRGIARLGRALLTGRLPVAELRRQLGRGPLRAAVPGVAPSLPRQVLRFGVIGVVSTLAYLGLFALLRTSMPAQPANAVALLTTAVGNTAANRRITFGVIGPGRRLRQQLRGFVVLGLALLLTSDALALLGMVRPHPSRAAELAALVVANALATLLRFLLYRAWVFRPASGVTLSKETCE